MIIDVSGAFGGLTGETTDLFSDFLTARHTFCLTGSRRVCIVGGVEEKTAHAFVLDFSNLTEMSEITELNLARSLRAQGLFTRASQGRGHKKTQPTAHELGNFILAQSAGQASEAAEAINGLRQMIFRGIEPPVFGPGTFGEVFDRMVSGRSHSGQAVSLPNEIRISTNPYKAVLIWLKTPTGEFDRANTYSSDRTERPAGANYLLKQTFIHPKLIELAWQFLGIENAAPARAAPSFDQSVDTATEKSEPRKPDITSVTCVYSTQEIDTVTEIEACLQLVNA